MGGSTSYAGPPRTNSSYGNTPTRLDVPKIYKLVHYYFGKGLATSTQRTYKSAQDRFLHFCQAGGFSLIPVSQSLLCMYVSYLAEQKLKHSSIKVYLSAVRNLQIASGHSDPFAGAAMPQLD